VLRLSGPLFWANANTIDDRLMAMADKTPNLRALVIDLEATTQLDTTSTDVLERVVDRLQARGVDVFLVRVVRAVRNVLDADGILQRLGEDHVWHSISAGVREAKKAEPLVPAGVLDGQVEAGLGAVVGADQAAALPGVPDVEIEEDEGDVIDQERIATPDRDTDADTDEESSWWLTRIPRAWRGGVRTGRG
jgi:anti-anti-sigma factor